MNGYVLPFGEQELQEVLDSVIDSLMHVRSVVLPKDQGGPAENPGPLWTVSVPVSGAFNGAITLVCSRRFAFRVASAMFDTADVQEDAARDAVAELVHIVGGNIKGLFGNGCKVELSQIVPGTSAPARMQQLEQLWSDCDGERIGIGVWKSVP